MYRNRYVRTILFPIKTIFFPYTVHVYYWQIEFFSKTLLRVRTGGPAPCLFSLNAFSLFIRSRKIFPCKYLACWCCFGVQLTMSILESWNWPESFRGCVGGAWGACETCFCKKVWDRLRGANPETGEMLSGGRAQAERLAEDVDDSHCSSESSPTINHSYEMH